jgi:hypothetical protein
MPLKKVTIFILFFALIISIFFVSATFFLKPYLKDKVLDIAKGSIGEEIEISEFDIDLLKGIISLGDFSIRDSKLIKYHNAVAADKAIFDVDLIRLLLQKKLVLQKICLKNFELSLRNVKSLPQLVEAAPPAVETSESKAFSPKPDVIFDTLYIQRLLIEDSRILFADHTVSHSPVVIKVVNIDGGIEDLSVPLAGGGILKGIAHLKGRLNSRNEGLFELDGSFAKTGDAVDFDFKFKMQSVDLTRFSPYYSNTSFTILDEAKLDLESQANCLKNQLNAFQDARIYDIELYDIVPGEGEKLFGLPAKTVIDFFEELKGDMRFSFNIVGTIDDPKFDPGPLIQQVLSNALRDKIISKLQELPREVIKMSEKALDENLGLDNGLEILHDEKIKGKIKDIEKSLKRMIEY